LYDIKPPSGGDVTERELVEAAQRGDASAFTALARRHADRVYALANRILLDPTAAEDASQQAFVRAWQGLPRLRDIDRFETWLRRLVVRACFDWRKAEGGYLAGILAAGIAPDAATAGFLGGDTTSLDVDAFEAGFRSGVESAGTSIGVANERVGFNDGPGARSAMTRLLDAGSRVVFAAAGPAARDAMALAAERSAFVIGADEDESSLAPGVVIASVRVRADVVVGRLLAARSNGDLTAGIYEFGAGDGSIDLYLNPALATRVPSAVVSRIDAATEAFRSGTLSLESPR
jgi:hypothetical protein